MEIIPRGQDAIAEDYKRMIARIVDERVAEALAEHSTRDFMPFFETKEVAYEIKRRQTVHQQRKFNYAYQDWGCLVCGTTERPHRMLWMCQKCYSRAHQRLLTSLRRRTSQDDEPDMFPDTAIQAQRALLPSIEVLAKKRRGK